MNDVAPDARDEPPSKHGYVPRETICFSRRQPGQALYKGEPGFQQELERLFTAPESNASEQLVKLKSRLRSADTESFWEMLVEGLAKISDAQYAFVSKRMVVDDENLAVEMPPIGEPGSCLMAAAFYFNDGHGNEVRLRNMKYHAYSCPCAYMRHDKILIIPERLNDFILDNPNNLAVPAEAYLGVPLFAEGKCFAHFGVMWSAEGLANKKLGWGYLEMLFHSLEDMILGRVIGGKNFADGLIFNQAQPKKVVPHEAVTAAQSLKPYARSLSHELRTPMQGVVGMLDVMYATVQEAAEDQKDSRVRKVLESLKENIEIVQDSSRRAVEAADNVVHAYDMNMGFPEMPTIPDEDETPEGGVKPPHQHLEKRPEIVVAGNNISLNLRSGKRRRESVQWSAGKALKRHKSESVEWSARNAMDLDVDVDPSHPAKATASLVGAMAVAHSITERAVSESRPLDSPAELQTFPSERTVVPGLRHTSLHDVFRYIINDSLKVGGRPEAAIAQQTDDGEIIEVMTRSSSGEERTKMIEWSVNPLVPESILIDERDLSKMISCVVLNALKFTEEGKITVTARLSPRGRAIVISVRDTGSGIPPAFLPNLFKPFSREDDSLTRQSEGLGLGLLVAKGLSRKLGGDLICVRSETTGPNKGSDFEMRIPLTPGDVISLSGSPHSSPTPSAHSRHSRSVEMERTLTPGERVPSVQAATKPEIRKDSIRDPRHPANGSSSGQLNLAPPSATSPLHKPATGRRYSTPTTRRLAAKPPKSDIDRSLAKRHPLNFLVAEDNKINRKLLVSMLRKLGYSSIREAYDGADAVRQWSLDFENGREIDVVLMDLWMPYMDGYEATEKILSMAAEDDGDGSPRKVPTILAVTADVTDGALERAAKVGMKGFMTKPYKLIDLEKLIVEYCSRQGTDQFL